MMMTIILFIIKWAFIVLTLYALFGITLWLCSDFWENLKKEGNDYSRARLLFMLFWMVCAILSYATFNALPPKTKASLISWWDSISQ